MFPAIRSRALALVLAVMTSSLIGCAGKRMSKPEIAESEVPQDFRENFDATPTDVAPKTAGPELVGPVMPPGYVRPVAEEKRPEAQAENPAKILPAKTPEEEKEEEKEAEIGPQPETTPEFVIPNRRPSKDGIWVGERLRYEVTYFGVPAGDFTLEVLPFKTLNGRKVYHVHGLARSSAVFSLFYRLNDTIDSFFDYEGMFSYRFEVILDESKQTSDALELYDHKKMQAFFWNRWNHYQKGYQEIKEYGKIDPLSQDIVSALFYVRNLPLPDGAVISIPVVSQAKSWDCVVTVLRHETLDTPLGEIRTIVLKPETKLHGVLEKKGDMFIWLTDDDRRFLVQLEAKVKVGAVFGRLKKVESLGTPP